MENKYCEIRKFPIDAIIAEQASQNQERIALTNQANHAIWSILDPNNYTPEELASAQHMVNWRTNRFTVGSIVCNEVSGIPHRRTTAQQAAVDRFLRENGSTEVPAHFIQPDKYETPLIVESFIDAVCHTEEGKASFEQLPPEQQLSRLLFNMQRYASKIFSSHIAGYETNVTNILYGRSSRYLEDIENIMDCYKIKLTQRSPKFLSLFASNQTRKLFSLPPIEDVLSALKDGIPNSYKSQVVKFPGNDAASTGRESMWFPAYFEDISVLELEQIHDFYFRIPGSTEQTTTDLWPGRFKKVYNL